MFRKPIDLQPVNLDSLEFQAVHRGSFTFYESRIGENHIVSFDFNYDDRHKVSLAIVQHTPATAWYSDDPADWPVLDKAFGGRKVWQKFCENLQEQSLEETKDEEG